MATQPRTRQRDARHVVPSKGKPRSKRKDGDPRTKKKQTAYDAIGASVLRAAIRPRAKGDARDPRVVEIGKRILMARLQLAAKLQFSVSQAMVAGALDLYPHSIGRFENGNREASTSTIIALASVLGTTPCYLLFGCTHTMDKAATPPSIPNRSGMHLLGDVRVRRRKGKKG